MSEGTELARRDGVLNGDADPACWSWPLPQTVTFRDDKGASAFLRWWNHCCAICGDDTGLVKDHDHETMLVRGYLCPNCNIQEGRSREPDGVFARYRIRNPAIILGVRERYHSPRPVAATAPSTARASAAQSRRRLAGAIREARERAGMSQSDVARSLRAEGFLLSQQALARIEWAKRRVAGEELVMLAELFGMTPGELCAGL